jgi:hypothetical protein
MEECIPRCIASSAVATIVPSSELISRANATTEKIAVRWSDRLGTWTAVTASSAVRAGVHPLIRAEGRELVIRVCYHCFLGLHLPAGGQFPVSARAFVALSADLIHRPKPALAKRIYSHRMNWERLNPDSECNSC